MTIGKKIMAIGVGIAAVFGLLGAGITGTVLNKNFDVQLADVQLENQNTLDALQVQWDANMDAFKDATDVEKLAIQEQLDKLVVDIGKLTEQAEKDALIIAEYEELLREQEEQTQAESFDGYEFNSIYLGEEFSDIVKDNDFAKLQDGKVRFDGENYDVHDEVVFEPSLFLAVNGLGYDEDFGLSPYLTTDEKNSIVYKYVFDDSIDFTEISDDEPLEILFAGEEWKITEADGNSITLEKGTSVFLREGDTTEFDGKVIQLEYAADDEAYVTVDGEGTIIEEGDSETVNGVDVKVVEVLSNDRGGIATLAIGDSVVTDLDDGDDFMDVDDYKFKIITNGNELEGLEVEYKPEFSDANDEPMPLTVGNSLVFPNGFYTFEFTELLNTESGDYTISFDEIQAEDELLEDSNAIIFESSDDEGLHIDDEEVSYVFAVEESRVHIAKDIDAIAAKVSTTTYTYYYEDSDGDIIKADSRYVTLVNDDAEVVATMYGGGLVLDDGVGETIIDVDVDAQIIGTIPEEAEANDIVYEGFELGNIENDALLPYGTILYNIENSLENDEIELSIPSDEVEAIFRLY